MAGDVDYMLRVVVTDIHGYDVFYKRLIAAVPLKNVTSRFRNGKDQIRRRHCRPVILAA